MESPWRQEPGSLRTESLVGFLSAPAPGPWILQWLMDGLEVGWTLTGKTCRAGGGLEKSHVPGCIAFIETLHLFHSLACLSAPHYIRTAPSAPHTFFLPVSPLPTPVGFLLRPRPWTGLVEVSSDSPALGLTLAAYTHDPSHRFEMPPSLGCMVYIHTCSLDPRTFARAFSVT